MNEQRIDELAREIFIYPDLRVERMHLQAQASIRRAINEALAEAAAQINLLCANPPEEYAKFDLRQGWDYALDQAEQRILALKLP